MSENALITVENVNPFEVFVEGKIEGVKAIIQNGVAQALEGATLETDAGRKIYASAAYKVARSKTFLDEIGKKLTDKQREEINNNNANRKLLREFCESLQKETRAPLTEWEEAERRRVWEHENDIATIRALANPNTETGEPCDSAMLRAKLAEVRAFEMGDIWEEYKTLAAKVKDESITALESHIERRETYEAEQAELERLRAESAAREKREYEERIAREAADKARRDAESKAASEAQRLKDEKEAAERREREAKETAERAAREAIERAERAERDRIAAEERAKAEKESAVLAAEEKARLESHIERLAKEAEAKAEAERIATNKNHRKAVRKSSVSAIMAVGNFPEDDANRIFNIIDAGKVPNITVNY